MDKPIKINRMGQETKSWSKREENEDGSSKEVRVEEVDGGFIKIVSKRFKDDEGNWQYKDTKSVHTENPLEEKSMAEKLESSRNEEE
jgi:hypothetical protein